MQSRTASTKVRTKPFFHCPVFLRTKQEQKKADARLLQSYLQVDQSSTWALVFLSLSRPSLSFRTLCTNGGERPRQRSICRCGHEKTCFSAVVLFISLSPFLLFSTSRFGDLGADVGCFLYLFLWDFFFLSSRAKKNQDSAGRLDCIIAKNQKRVRVEKEKKEKVERSVGWFFVWLTYIHTGVTMFRLLWVAGVTRYVVNKHWNGSKPLNAGG